MSNISDKAIRDWLNGKINFTFQKTFVFRGLVVEIEKRSKDNLMGRFGGGWDIEFGFQHGGVSTIINLFVMSIRITNDKKYREKYGEHSDAWERANRRLGYEYS